MEGSKKRRPNLAKLFMAQPLSQQDKLIIGYYDEILDILKNMDISFVMNLFKSLDITDIISININKVGYFCDHYFVYIKSIITRDKDEIIINQMFYKSSGLSRSTGLKDIWLPTTGISFDMIKKLEDNYIIYYENLIHKREYNNDYINKDLLLYGRFITEINAKISKFLYQQEQKNQEIFKGPVLDISHISMVRSFPGRTEVSYAELIPDLETNIINIPNILEGGRQYYKFINFNTF